MYAEVITDRQPLRWEEIPLPPGTDEYRQEMLRPEEEARRVAEHEDKVQRIMAARLMYIERAPKDEELQDLLIEQCRRSVSFFINYFCFTYDDRVGVDMPFILWDVQEAKMVEPYDSFRRVVAPARVTHGYTKSRGQGFTWVACATRLHSFSFLDNWSILVGTENRDDVDDGGQGATHETLFGKIRYLLAHLPTWFRRKVYGPGLGKDENNKRWHLRNPARPKNVIHGKQLGEMFGRSRRYSEVWADEVAWAEEMKNADTSLKQTTNRFMFGSTPRGRGNFFDQAMHGQIPGVIRFNMWWPEGPIGTVDWYNEQRAHMTDEQVAQELDMNFDLSLGGRVLPEVLASTHFTKLAVYDPHLPLEVVIDPGFADPMAAVWVQWDEVHAQGRVIDFVQTERKSVDWIVPFILGRIPGSTYRGEPWPHHYNAMEEEIIRRHSEWEAPVFVYGDAAGGARTWTTGASAWDELGRYEIWVDEIKILNDAEALKRLELFMRHVRIDEKMTWQRNGPRRYSPTFLEVLTQWRYPKKKENATNTQYKPVHDMFCHGGDCLKMWAQTRDLPDSVQVPVASGRIKRARGSDIEYPDENSSPWRN